MPLRIWVLGLCTGTNGFLDKVPVARIPEWEQAFYQYMDTSRPEVGQAILRDKRLDETNIDGLRVALDDFNKQFLG